MSDKSKTKRKLSPQLAAYNKARDAAKASGKASFMNNGKKYVKKGGRYEREGKKKKKEEEEKKKSGRKKSGRKKSPAKKKKSRKKSREKSPCKDNKIRVPKNSRCRPGPNTKCNKEGQVRRKVPDGKRKGKYDCVSSPKKKKRKRSKSPRKKSQRKAKGFIGDMRRNKGEGYVGLGAFGIAGGRKRSRRRSRRR